MQEWADVVADSVLQTFDRLPLKAKPRIHQGGKQEWTPLCGIVLSKDGKEQAQCVSLGTGMRCLPASKVPLANGCCLHDWHAEIVSIRALNLFLVQQIATIAADPLKVSPWIRRRTDSEMSDQSTQPFALYDDVRIDMFCSQAPCGDASMELIINAQADSTPWDLGIDSDVLRGRGYFSELGVVRRKPARSDAPETLSKSCSDKLALKQCTSLLSSLTSLIIHPRNAYLQNLIIPMSQFASGAITRAFSQEGRMRGLNLNNNGEKIWCGGYIFKAFNVLTTSRNFKFSKSYSSFVGSNIAAVWTPDQQEVLIGGTIQGHKQFSARGASAICNSSMWRFIFALAQDLHLSKLLDILERPRYCDFKNGEQLLQRRKVKEYIRRQCLKNWIRNDGDEHFQLQDLLPK